MSLESIVVTKRREGTLGHRAKNYNGSGETQGIDTADIMYFTPSVCKRDGESHGVTNSLLYVKSGDQQVKLWSTSTVAEITALDTTNLKNVTVRKRKDGGMQRNGKLFSSETQGVNVNAISYFIPSLSKKDGVTDNLVSAQMEIDVGEEEKIKLWITQTVAEIAALDD